CCAPATASVRRFSRLRTLKEPESKVAAIPTIVSVIPMPTINSSSENPASVDFGSRIVFIFRVEFIVALPQSVNVCSDQWIRAFGVQLHRPVIFVAGGVVAAVDRNYRRYWNHR